MSHFTGRQKIRRLALLLAAIVLLSPIGPAASVAQPGPAVNSTDHSEMLDFDTLQRPGSPNTWLIEPAAEAGWDPPEPDAVAPTFELPAARLAEHWRDLVASQQRSRVLGVSADGLQVEAEQRSALFGFVDRISFRAVPLGQGRSTFAAYSRSGVGYWDLGVNRRRLQAWVAELTRAVGQGAASR
jgi:uncharacterized protein (DUF1499 family)